jgi:hypothetical protein
MVSQDERQGSPILAPRRLVLFLAPLVIAILLATSIFWLPNRGPAAAGKELGLEGIESTAGMDRRTLVSGSPTV